MAMAASASAQSYPLRPITMIVPFPPGGPVDTIGRIIGERMRALARPADHHRERAGRVGGSIGVFPGRARRGRRLHAQHGQLVEPRRLAGDLPGAYDVLKDFEPVALLPIALTLIVGTTALPANNLAELIAWLKANPDKATAGTVGAGSPSHVSGITFQNETGTRFQLVPYRGGAPATQDLVAGQIDMRMRRGVETLPYLRSRQDRGFAVLAKTPLAGGARHPDHRRGRACRDCTFVVERAVGAEGHAQGDHRASSMPPSRRRLADAAVRQRISNLGQEIPPTRAADAGGARRVSPGRDRQVVADHQGGKHQGGMNARSEWRVANRLPSYSLLATGCYSLLAHFWHTGQKNVERPVCTRRRMVPLQSGVGHGWPSRS